MEAWMEVTEEEYQKYYRPWWQQKKREQRNREAMEECGYKEESYEEWKENDMRAELFAESMEELAMKVFGEEVSVYEFARMNGGNRRTLDFPKKQSPGKTASILSGTWNRRLNDRIRTMFFSFPVFSIPIFLLDLRSDASPSRISVSFVRHSASVPWKALFGSWWLPAN